MTSNIELALNSLEKCQRVDLDARFNVVKESINRKIQESNLPAPLPA